MRLALEQETSVDQLCMHMVAVLEEDVSVLQERLCAARAGDTDTRVQVQCTSKNNHLVVATCEWCGVCWHPHFLCEIFAMETNVLDFVWIWHHTCNSCA